MDYISYNAELTIVAAGGDHDDCGVINMAAYKETRIKKDGAFFLLPINCGTPDRENLRKRWASRGWTFQESLLSRRCLVFTEERVYFECGQMSCWRIQVFQLPPINETALVEQLGYFPRRGPFLWKFPDFQQNILHC